MPIKHKEWWAHFFKSPYLSGDRNSQMFPYPDVFYGRYCENDLIFPSYLSWLYSFAALLDSTEIV